MQRDDPALGPRHGAQIRVLQDHKDRVRSVRTVQVGGRSLLATAGDDRTVPLWDPAGGS